MSTQIAFSVSPSPKGRKEQLAMARGSCRKARPRSSFTVRKEGYLLSLWFWILCTVPETSLVMDHIWSLQVQSLHDLYICSLNWWLSKTSTPSMLRSKTVTQSIFLFKKSLIRCYLHQLWSSHPWFSKNHFFPYSSIISFSLIFFKKKKSITVVLGFFPLPSEIYFITVLSMTHLKSIYGHATYFLLHFFVFKAAMMIQITLEKYTFNSMDVTCFQISQHCPLLFF